MISKNNKLKTSLTELEKGVSIEYVTDRLDWKDFEGLVAETLEMKNFETTKNLFLKKPRMEIDVVGIRLGFTILIDCKHWKKYSVSALRNVVNKQIIRTRHYLEKNKNERGVPVIVTLDCEKITFINKVPIVPIYQFESFIDEFFGNIDKMKIIKA